jgi:FkbM family methyltransferase
MTGDNLKSKFISMCESFNVRTSVEVGAHEASFSNEIRILPNIESIIAFEASPFVWRKYCSKIPEVIAYRNQAVSDKSGPITFYIQQDRSPTETLNNSILERAEAAKTHEVIVESITLDQLLPIKGPAALWVDVEGASREVLLGGRKFLAETALVFLEVEHQSYWKNQWLFEDILTFMETNGFLLHSIKEQYTNQSNCIFVNPVFCQFGTLKYLTLQIRHLTLPRFIWIIIWRAKKNSLKLIFYRGIFKRLILLIRRFWNRYKFLDK